MKVRRKTHPHVFENLAHELSAWEMAFGFSVKDRDYIRFVVEAVAHHKHMKRDDIESWAILNARSHHTVRRDGSILARVLIALIILFGIALLVLSAHGEPIPEGYRWPKINLLQDVTILGGQSVNLSAVGGTVISGSLYDSGNTAFKVNCVVGCSGGSTIPADAFANPSTAGLSFSLLGGWNGSTWDRLKSTTANGLQVDVTRVQGTIAATQSGTWTVQPGNTANTTAWKVDGSAVTQPVSGTVTANQGGTWTVQPGNTANTTAWKVDGSAVTQPVSLASTTITGTVAVTESGTWSNRVVGNAGGIFDTTQNATVPANALSVGCNFTTSPATVTTGNQGAAQCNNKGELLTQLTDGTTNVAVISGTTALKTDMSSVAGTATGTAAAGVQLVGIEGRAGTSFETTAGVLDYNLKNVSNSAVSTAATGVQKVGIVGNAGAVVDAANNAAAPANVIVLGVETIAQGSQPTAATAGNVRRPLSTTEGALFVQEGSSNRFSCFVQAVTVTTQCQAAPGAGLRAYITSAHFANQSASAQTLDIVFGTGANCVTGITPLTHKNQMGTLATTTSPFESNWDFITPLIPTAANAICVRPSGATAFGATLTGFIAP
jgi:hypothetical protein